MTESARIRRFTLAIWDWYAVHKRALPWRDLKEKNDDHRAYLVLVSEVMLQQTQVSRVIILYKQFIQRFPRIEDLANASNSEILIAWRGLGYNSRALRLRDAAVSILRDHDGVFPRSRDELMAISGIGHYTASAVLNFAFGIPTACMDVNIRRILHRFFVGPENGDGTWKVSDKKLLPLTEKILNVACPHLPASSPDRPSSSILLPRGEGSFVFLGYQRSPLPSGEGLGVREGRISPADWYAALMDFGSLVCTKNTPKWDLFSSDLKSCCKAYGKQIHRTKKLINREPGRLVGGRFIPNRIFRGRIIEELRDAKQGLTPNEIGRRIALDWTLSDETVWLEALLAGLERDQLVSRSLKRIILKN